MRIGSEMTYARSEGYEVNSSLRGMSSYRGEGSRKKEAESGGGSRSKVKGRGGERRKKKDSPHELRRYTNHRRHDIFPKNG